MATRIRDGVPGKEKKLPQEAKNDERRTSINPPSSSPSKPIGSKSKPPTSDKDIPNYLKPTKSRTTVDQPAQSPAAKKAAAAAATEKALLDRRRSFGKNVPPASQLPKTHQSPNPKEKNLQTSSSFPRSKSIGANPPKGASNRVVKTAAAAAKDGVPKPISSARPLGSKKTNNANTKKKGESSAEASMSSSVISSPERVHDPEILNAPHPHEDDSRQSSVTDIEVSVDALSSHVPNEEFSSEALSNYAANSEVVEEEQKTETPVPATPDTYEQEDIKIIKSRTSEVDNQNAAEGSTKREEVEDQNKTAKETSSLNADTQRLQEKLEDNTTDPVNENLEVQAEDQGKEVKDVTEGIKRKDEVKEKVNDATEAIKNKDKVKEEVKDASEAIKRKEDVKDATEAMKRKEEMKEKVKDVTEAIKSKDKVKEEVKDASGAIKRKEDVKDATEAMKKKNEVKEQVKDAVEAIKTKDEVKQQVKNATEAIKKKDEVKEEDQTVNLRETEEGENIASSKPEPGNQSETKLKPAPEQEKKQEQEPAAAIEETQTVTVESTIPVQEKKETSAVSNDVSAPEETQPVAAKRSIPVLEKKETSAVSNDEIEETASKLQEQRRNRVRALAGAFETVIARQEK